MAFRQYTDEFHGKDVSHYFYDELSQLSEDDLRERGISGENIAQIKSYDRWGTMTDEEFLALGFEQERSETMRETYRITKKMLEDQGLE
ncbi:MAG: hypothetical protein U0M15_00255 [Bacillota bacterium]|nr:hypothetical protein [Bacillota bacterium]